MKTAESGWVPDWERKVTCAGKRSSVALPVSSHDGSWIFYRLCQSGRCFRRRRRRRWRRWFLPIIIQAAAGDKADGGCVSGAFAYGNLCDSGKCRNHYIPAPGKKETGSSREKLKEFSIGEDHWDRSEIQSGCGIILPDSGMLAGS